MWTTLCLALGLLYTLRSVRLAMGSVKLTRHKCELGVSSFTKLDLRLCLCDNVKMCGLGPCEVNRNVAGV
jgi:hypothetical protein